MNRKILAIVIFLSYMCVMPVYALNVGTYQTESEYGLLDGFKINWKKKDKSQSFIEAREQSTKKERDKERKEIKENEYQYTKYLYEGKSIL